MEEKNKKKKIESEKVYRAKVSIYNILKKNCTFDIVLDQQDFRQHLS